MSSIPHNNEALFDAERTHFATHYDEEVYSRVGFRRRFERDLKQILQQRGKSGSTLGNVLSLGCGDGTFECMLSDYADEVVGVDISEAAIQKARAEADRLGLENVRFEVSPADEMEFDESFDMVVGLAFLHHVPLADMDAMLSKIYGWLNPGGMLYTQDPSKDGILRTIGRIILREQYDSYHSPDERELDMNELSGQVENAGFKSVEMGCSDFTLIPGSYFFGNGPGWLYSLFLHVDRLLCQTPMSSKCSGFWLSGWKT